MNTQQKNRYNKIFNEEIYLLDKFKEDNKLIFHISGSTANIYKVTIYLNHRNMFCDCPDMKSWAKKYNCVCKHCCFTLFKVLKLNLHHTNFFNNLALSDEDLVQINNNFDKLTLTNIDDNIDDNIINQQLLKKFQTLNLTNNNDNNDKNKKKDIFENNKEIDEDDQCVICFEDFLKNDIVSCPTCHNIIHKKCMEKWIKMGKHNCVYCRSEVWKKFGNNITNTTPKYINLFEQ